MAGNKSHAGLVSSFVPHGAISRLTQRNLAHPKPTFQMNRMERPCPKSEQQCPKSAQTIAPSICEDFGRPAEF